MIQCETALFLLSRLHGVDRSKLQIDSDGVPQFLEDKGKSPWVWKKKIQASSFSFSKSRSIQMTVVRCTEGC